MTRFRIGGVACVTLLYAGGALATTEQQRCDSARIGAWKKYQSCVEGVVAKHAKGAGFDQFAAFAKCRHKYFAKWASFQSITGSTCSGVRFANGGATVIDNLSGLEWEKKDNGAGIHDKDNVYTWSTMAPYKEDGTASSFLGTLNDGLFWGSSGWRLPTLAELQTIVLDFACQGDGSSPACSCPSDPCVDPTFDASNTQSNYYLSATAYAEAGGSGYAWVVDFTGGIVLQNGKTGGFPVRAVRGGF